jgi:hypothetical protein
MSHPNIFVISNFFSKPNFNCFLSLGP